MANRSRQRLQRKRVEKQRKNKFVVIAIGLAVLGFGAYVFTLNAPAAMPTDLTNVEVGAEVGSFAPDFTLSDINGAPVSLSEFRGKPVAIMFFHSW